MLNLSYNVSSDIKNSLDKVEFLRQKIALAPISPKMELKLRWEAMVDKIWGALALDKIVLTKTEITKILASRERKKLKPSELAVLGYRKAMNYIFQEWLGSPKTVLPETIIELHDLCSRGQFVVGIPDFKQFLDLIQTRPEHPIIQAAVAQIQIIRIRPFFEGNGRVALSLAQLFLDKNGYDFRRIFPIEEHFRHDKEEVEKTIEIAFKSGNLTGWLEYYANSFIAQLEKTMEKIKTSGVAFDLPASFWELTDRQKEIMYFLENPSVSITNKKAQKMFKVSQITASRDLSKLATLGLLFAHGKGRSVYYTRV